MFAGFLCRTGSSIPAPPPLLLPCLWSARKPLRSWTHFLLHQHRQLPRHKSASIPSHHWRPRRSVAELTVIAHVTSCSNFCSTVSTSAKRCHPLHCGTGTSAAPMLASVALLLSLPSVRHAVVLTYTLFHIATSLSSLLCSNLATTSSPLPCCRQPPWTETDLPLPQERKPGPSRRQQQCDGFALDVPFTLRGPAGASLSPGSANHHVDDEQSAKCSSCLCVEWHHTLQLYRESPKKACNHAKQG